MTTGPEQDVCAYVRISDDRTGEHASIARQRKLIRELADQIKIDPESIRWFEDKSKSASHGLRPAFAELMAAVRNGEVSTVLVWVADRLWRNADDQHEIDRVFGPAKVTVRAAQGNDLNFATAEGRFTGRVIGAASSYEVERKSERILIATRDRAVKGRFSGGVRRFGYTQRDTRVHRTMDDAGRITEELRPSGPLVLVPAEADAIADGYRQMSEGASLNSIVRDWRARGLIGVQGGPLTPQAVRDTLLRPANAGLSVHRGAIVGRAEWPAIIDADTWATVKALLQDPARRTNVGRPATNLLSGILRCATCQGPMLSSSKMREQTYRCRSGRELPDPDGGRHMSRRRAKLDVAISEIILRYLQANAAAIARPSKTTTTKSVASAITLASKLRTQIEAYQLQADAFNPADLAALLRGLRAQLAAAEAGIEKAAGRPATQALIKSGDIRAAWDAMDTAGRRVVIKENLSRIEVGAGKPGSRYATMHGVRLFDRDGKPIEWTGWPTATGGDLTFAEAMAEWMPPMTDEVAKRVSAAMFPTRDL